MSPRKKKRTQKQKIATAKLAARSATRSNETWLNWHRKKAQLEGQDQGHD